MYKCFESENDLIFYQTTKVKSFVWPVYHSITSIVNVLTDVTLVVQNVAGVVQAFFVEAFDSVDTYTDYSCTIGFFLVTINKLVHNNQ